MESRYDEEKKKDNSSQFLYETKCKRKTDGKKVKLQKHINHKHSIILYIYVCVWMHVKF